MAQELGEEPPPFRVSPSNGVLLPHRKLQLQVDFRSFRAWRYHHALIVDVEGARLAARRPLPLKGTC